MILITINFTHETLEISCVKLKNITLKNNKDS